MENKYNSEITLGEVALNVVDLEKQTDFYVNNIGLDVIEKYENKVLLGIKGKNGSTPLVKLQKVEKENNRSYGLYHLAILVPTRKDLGNVLKHLLMIQTRLVGGANHGYSEAIYLEDVEGNGIEIYRDRPMSEWDIQGDKIIGVTLELDADGVLASSDRTFGEDDPLGRKYKIPENTVMGHVHLSVKNSGESSEFYQKLFNMGDKFSVPSGSWLASGNYHHHLAVNQWGGPNLAKRELDYAGLNHYVVYANNKEIFEKIKENAEKLGTLVEEREEKFEFVVEDVDGIRGIVRL